MWLMAGVYRSCWISSSLPVPGSGTSAWRSSPSAPGSRCRRQRGRGQRLSAEKLGRQWLGAGPLRPAPNCSRVCGQNMLSEGLRTEDLGRTLPALFACSNRMTYSGWTRFPMPNGNYAIRAVDVPALVAPVLRTQTAHPAIGGFQRTSRRSPSVAPPCRDDDPIVSRDATQYRSGSAGLALGQASRCVSEPLNSHGSFRSPSSHLCSRPIRAARCDQSSGLRWNPNCGMVPEAWSWTVSPLG